MSGYAFLYQLRHLRTYTRKVKNTCYQGGEERDEYLQELENSDPWFYVSPVSGAILQTAVSNDTSKHSSLHLCSFFIDFQG